MAILQYMAAAAFLSLAIVRLAVWLRVRSETIHLLFAFTLITASANAVAEANMYEADSIPKMAVALKAYVSTSGLWALATVWFIAVYSRVSKFGFACAIAFSMFIGAAMTINMFAPASFLYSELHGLRLVRLPWGEEIYLAMGRDHPLRVAFEWTTVSLLIVVADGCRELWIRQERRRSVLFGLLVLAFLLCFGTHASLVDSGRLNSPYLSTFGFLALIGLMTYELAGEVVERSQLISKLAKHQHELRDALVNERTRIAGELHDSVTQTLCSITAIADALPAVWERHPAEAKRGLDDLKLLSQGAVADMRTLLVELHPTALLQHPLGDLVEKLTSAASGRMRKPIATDIHVDVRLPADVHVAVYRIAQEALQNVTKHSDANTIKLRLVSGQSTLTLCIDDDGRGFDCQDAARKGMGLELMHERARAIGADCQVVSSPGNGTQIRVKWIQHSDEIR